MASHRPGDGCAFGSADLHRRLTERLRDGDANEGTPLEVGEQSGADHRRLSSTDARSQSGESCPGSLRYFARLEESRARATDSRDCLLTVEPRTRETNGSSAAAFRPS